MLKVSTAVAEIVGRSLEASIMLQQGCLNLSAYAKHIKLQVESRTKKPVKLGSIVIALSRLSRSIQDRPEPLPPPSALEVSVRSGLMEVVFERTQKNLELFRLLQKEVGLSPTDFFMATQGTAEITVIAPEERLPQIRETFHGVKPKFTMKNLSGLTVHTTDKDIFTPNVFFSMIYPFAMRHINIVEIISTYTEITMIFEDKDLQEAFEVLKGFLKKR